jgi:arylsulfatase A-like enzyme
MSRAAAVALLLSSLAACTPRAFQGPVHLLDTPAAGPSPHTAIVTIGTESRPALLSPAAYQLALPAHGLLTFGMGVRFAGEGEAPGWFKVVVKADGAALFERSLNPREMVKPGGLHGWRGMTVPLEGLGARARLEIDLRLVSREGAEVPVPAGLTLAVSDPVVHDLADYGRHKGIVLISIDTLRRDHVSAYGYPKATTPRLDALAKAGILCDDAVSTSSWTLPAHLSMLTSSDPGVHGGTNMNLGYNHRPPTLASILKTAGYATQAVTSHLYVSAKYGVDTGFDHLEYNQYHIAPQVAGRGVDLLDRFGDRPFFVFLHFYDPHTHYEPHDKTLDLFETRYTGGLSGRWGDFKERDPATLPAADMAHLLALYDNEIRFTDDAVGRVLDRLAELGLDKSTLVVVTSDHGEEFGEHGSWEHQKTLYEEVVRIPLVLRGPGVAARRETAPVSLLDVAPTIVAWAGVDAKWQPQGQSLLRPVGPRDPMYGETDRTIDETRKLFYRDGASGGKTILSLRADASGLAREEWYDLAADARETRDARPREEAAEARRQRMLARWRAGRAGGPASTVTFSPEEREQLRALGYIK